MTHLGFPESGSIFYKDSYGQLYTVGWETNIVDGQEFLDFTTIVKIPYVWGEEDQGFIKNRQVFRNGICMTQRQIFAITDDGYEIVAEGESSFLCLVQTTFNCGDEPSDPFKYHLDSYVCDEVQALVTCGPRFTDPELPENYVAFDEVAVTGGTSTLPGRQPFQFVDVWGNDEDLDAFCDLTEIDRCPPCWADMDLVDWADLDVECWALLEVCVGTS
jgi:hypothetical protein